MKSNNILAIGLASCTMLVGANAYALTSNSSPENQKNKSSYTVGYDLGYAYSSVKDVVDTDMIISGLEDGLDAKKPSISLIEMQKSRIALQKDINVQLQKNAVKLAENNKAASAKFMAKVASSKGVRKLQDGIFYKIDEKGNGGKPKSTDYVTLRYQGKLINGSVFYDTFKYNKEETFLLSSTIVGWQKSIDNMPAGSTWTIYIAPEHAYGEKGPLSIGPNQALIYKIKLVAVKPAA